MGWGIGFTGRLVGVSCFHVKLLSHSASSWVIQNGSNLDDACQITTGQKDNSIIECRNARTNTLSLMPGGSHCSKQEAHHLKDPYLGQQTQRHYMSHSQGSVVVCKCQMYNINVERNCFKTEYFGPLLRAYTCPYSSVWVETSSAPSS